MGQNEKALFYKHLYAAETRFYYEFGSGGSTFKAIHAPNIARIVSLESDTSYYINTLPQLTAPKCERIFVDVDCFNNWGNPAAGIPKSRYELYFKHFDSVSPLPDLVLIDGRWRVACALHVWMRSAAAAGKTLVLVDDFQRAEYSTILDYFDVVERAGNMVALRPRSPTAVPDIAAALTKYEADYR